MNETTADPLATVRRVIVVSNVLPVQLTKNPSTNKWSVEFDTNPLFEDGPILTGIANSTQNAIFVGVPPKNIPAKDREEVEEALARKNCYPVYVSAKEASFHYQGMCKSILWPLFHNVIDLYNDVQIETVSRRVDFARPQTPQEDGGDWHPARSFNPQEIEVLWPAHMDFIMKFRSAIVSLYSEGDLVWIHDYHLIMLVGPLRRSLPRVSRVVVVVVVVVAPFCPKEKTDEIIFILDCSNWTVFTHSFPLIGSVSLFIQKKRIVRIDTPS